MVNPEAVNCDLVWREISNYVEGVVSPTLRAAIDEHVYTCERCASVLSGIQNVIRLYGDERMIEVPSGFGVRLERRLARAPRVRSAGWSTWSAWLIPVAALALIAGGYRVASSTVVHPLQSAHAQPGRHIPPDMKVVVTENAKLFHAPGCEFIHNKDKERTLTAGEAMREGYAPCLRCMRKYMQTATAEKIATESEAELYAAAEPARPGR